MKKVRDILLGIFAVLIPSYFIYHHALQCDVKDKRTTRLRRLTGVGFGILVVGIVLFNFLILTF